MEQKTVTCIVCPQGCLITVDQNGETLHFAGNRCVRGESYARDEYTAPKRIVTTTAIVTGASDPLVAVRSAAAVPKEMQRRIVDAVSQRTFPAPIRRGDVLIANVLNTGVDIIATADAHA